MASQAFTAAVVLVLCIAPAGAWTPETRAQMVRDAVSLSPPSLQRMLERYRRPLMRGMKTRVSEAEAGHFQHADGSGRLVEAAATSLQTLRQALESGEALKRIAYRMGRVAHLVGDLNNPLASSADDPREALYAEDFARYVERMLPKYRRTLKRREPAGLDDESLRAWARQAVERARELYEPIGRSYWIDGKLVRSESFDERSIPFGVGSLAYARAVNDLIQAWMVIWRESGGDVSGSLYEQLLQRSDETAGVEKARSSSK
ncbi:MAG: hypothetical protein V3U98_00755 [Acidobacteriota bacterium]